MWMGGKDVGDWSREIEKRRERERERGEREREREKERKTSSSSYEDTNPIGSWPHPYDLI